MALKKILFRRRESVPIPHFKEDDVNILNYENNQSNIKLQFVITRTDGSETKILSKESVRQGFETFGDTFGDSLGLTYEGIITTSTKAGYGENKSPRRAITGVLVTLALLIVFAAIVVAVWHFKKK